MSRNAVDWSPSRRSNSELHSSEFSLSEDARIASYAYLNYFYRVATPFQNFSVDFLEEGPLTSLPLPNVRTRFFLELTFHAAPHIGRQLSREVL